jgi:hypothetical protein
MNIILNPNQDGTKRGDIQLPAYSNLTTAGAGGGPADGFLVKIVNNNGAANFGLPTALSDPAFFILAQSDVAGNTVSAESPGLDEQCRLQCSGTVVPGQYLGSNAALYGTVFGTVSTGSAIVDWIAEEAAVGTVAAPVLVKARRIARFLY